VFRKANLGVHSKLVGVVDQARATSIPGSLAGFGRVALEPRAAANVEPAAGWQVHISATQFA
jgi:hypothetical protein